MNTLKLIIIIALLVLAPRTAHAQVQRSYGWGMDNYGGGVTSGRPTFRTPRPRPGWATPWDGVPQHHASPPAWNARWQGWQRPGYFGGEANYHDVFGNVR